MATCGDLQNGLLQRCRQTGVNWGGTPTNTASSLLPPYRVLYELNQAYSRVLALVKDFPIATLEVELSHVAKTRAGSRSARYDQHRSMSAHDLRKSVLQLGLNYSLPNPPNPGDTVAIVVASSGSLVRRDGHRFGPGTALARSGRFRPTPSNVLRRGVRLRGRGDPHDRELCHLGDRERVLAWLPDGVGRRRCLYDRQRHERHRDLDGGRSQERSPANCQAHRGHGKPP